MATEPGTLEWLDQAVEPALDPNRSIIGARVVGNGTRKDEEDGADLSEKEGHVRLLGRAQRVYSR